MLTAKVLERLVGLRGDGHTLRECAAVAGIHVATLCRWQAGDPAFRERMREARRQALDGREPARPPVEYRPQVPWRRDCPLCKARVAVRTAAGKARFWRCGRWPLCPWASWRPRAPRNCARCGAPRYWSHSRCSIECSGCRRRTWVAQPYSPPAGVKPE